MSPPVIAGLVAAAVAALVLTLVIVTRRRERARTEALRQLAETARLTFEERGDVTALQSLGDLKLFGRGHGKRVRNLMRGRIDDQEVAVFDYEYTIGSGKQQRTMRETVLLLPGARRSLPDLQMAPENIFTRIGEAFGYQDIDIEPAPEFSRSYVVKGPDEAAIRAALYPNATSYFAAHQGWSVEVLGGTVALYRGDHRPKAEEMRSFIDEGLGAARNL